MFPRRWTCIKGSVYLLSQASSVLGNFCINFHCLTFSFGFPAALRYFFCTCRLFDGLARKICVCVRACVRFFCNVTRYSPEERRWRAPNLLTIGSYPQCFETLKHLFRYSSITIKIPRAVQFNKTILIKNFVFELWTSRNRRPHGKQKVRAFRFRRQWQNAFQNKIGKRQDEIVYMYVLHV